MIIAPDSTDDQRDSKQVGGLWFVVVYGAGVAGEAHAPLDAGLAVGAAPGPVEVVPSARQRTAPQLRDGPAVRMRSRGLDRGDDFRSSS
jgi:hypothetical protein